MANKWTCWLALLVTFAVNVWANGETVVIADGKTDAAWVGAFARGTEGEVINALRPGWKSSDVWYVREILGQHPQAAAFVIMATPEDLRHIDAVDPEAVARVGARLGYMADIIHETIPSAKIMLVAPPQIDPGHHAGFAPSALILSEMLAANIEKNARERNARFVSLLDLVPVNSVSAEVIPSDKKWQEKLGKKLALELSENTASAPLCAQVARLAPPAEGRPVVDDSGANALASAIAADLAAMPQTPAPAISVTQGAQVRNYISNRDTSKIVSEEGITLARGAMAAIAEVLDSAMSEREETCMNAMFNLPGADEYAVISREAPVNEALISAIVPPKAAEGFMGAVVDWNAVEVPENPAFNAVKLAAAPAVEKKTEIAEKKAPAMEAEDFADDPDAVNVPGMTEFDTNPAVVSAKDNTREPVIARPAEDAPQQDLRNAPWNKPVQVASAAENQPRADKPAETPAVAAATVKTPAVKKFADYPLPDGEGGIDDVPAVKIEKLFTGEETIAGTAQTAGELNRYINKENTMVPLSASAPAPVVPGYALYVHTAAE